MKNKVLEKISFTIDKIIESYFKLIRLELDHFRLKVLCEGIQIGDKILHLTPSGEDEKIKQRIDTMSKTFYSQKDDIIDSFFMTIAKLFDMPQRSKPISIPSLIDCIFKNIHLFDDKDQIQLIINSYLKKIEFFQVTVNTIKEHRDKCLAHNDPKITCTHLYNLSTNDTRNLMDIIKFVVNSFSPYFSSNIIDENKIKQMQSDSYNENYKLMETFEQ